MRFLIEPDQGAESVTTDEPLQNEPSSVNFSRFNVDQEPLPPEDPSIAATKRNQHRLFVYHERFGHIGFARLKLLARAGLIPRELANVDAPVCPGCAYGKAHRKPKTMAQ